MARFGFWNMALRQALDDNFIVPLISCIVIQTTVDHMQEDNGGMLL